MDKVQPPARRPCTCAVSDARLQEIGRLLDTEPVWVEPDRLYDGKRVFTPDGPVTVCWWCFFVAEQFAGDRDFALVVGGESWKAKP